ncbi:DUF3859 domain-containing protein [Agaribacterium sp. ZY112]|uniref:DUF3859 domain-containing protein n=1 Tax=Agaribacterium sp. ZY112 TaxID=3233574 RepID=UPI0035262D12
MPKAKIETKLVSYGIYTKWDANCKKLPKLQRFTTEVPAEIDIEFGMIINIKKAKGKQIHCCIDHPGVLDEHGQKRPPFKDTLYIRDNNWDFFLGDTVWAPVADKLGKWALSIELEGQVIAQKTFHIAPYQETQVKQEESLKDLLFGE